jgi:hypothetical protein
VARRLVRKVYKILVRKLPGQQLSGKSNRRAENFKIEIRFHLEYRMHVLLDYAGWWC